MRILVIIMAMFLLAPMALGDTVVEKSSKTEFPASITLKGPEGEVNLNALGTGLRKKAIFKVYAGCFYVDAEAKMGDDPAAAAISGNFAKRIDMHFLRDVGGDKIAGAFREGIQKTMKGHEEQIDAFCKLFTEEVKKGESIVLTYLPGFGLVAEQAGEELGTLKEGHVISALWATWFGDDPISDDLKEGMLGL
jgi:hypothetical protein